MLKIVRLDDRLVHGQIINNWCTSEDITEIMVVNADVYENEMRKTIISMSVPDNINIIFCNVEEALEVFEEECKYENLMMVFENPFEIYDFIEKCGKIKRVNIGGMSFKNGKKRIATAVYVNDSELEVLRKIEKKNVELEIRLLPTDRSINFSKIK